MCLLLDDGGELLDVKLIWGRFLLVETAFSKSEQSSSPLDSPLLLLSVPILGFCQFILAVVKPDQMVVSAGCAGDVVG